jgi:ABC-2 type transport system ATP-binding protein
MIAADLSPTLALDVQEVSHSFGARRALDGVSLSVAPASFTVLLGLNGAGKSTLFSLITRLFATRVGSIRIFGHDVAREPGPALSQLGVVFQSRALDIDISVDQNLAYHLAMHGIGGSQAKERIGEMLQQAGLTELRREKVGHLSGGQMRRVEIVRALLHRPRLLLLDEPTVGLDVKARADILGHVRHLLTDRGVGVLWATHLIDEVAPSDDVVVLHKGRVLTQGPVADVLATTGKTSMGAAFVALTQMGGGDREDGAP